MKVQFFNHLLQDDGIKDRAEVHKKYPCIGVLSVRVGQYGVLHCGDCILCGSVGVYANWGGLCMLRRVDFTCLETNHSKHFLTVEVSVTGRVVHTCHC